MIGGAERMWRMLGNHERRRNEDAYIRTLGAGS